MVDAGAAVKRLSGKWIVDMQSKGVDIAKNNALLGCASVKRILLKLSQVVNYLFTS